MREALEKSGLLASRLELDLTEATVMTEAEETTDRLRQLRELGVQLALDDFGTGYFSIGRIRDLGFSRLKIDRSLVSGLPGSPSRRRTSWPSSASAAASASRWWRKASRPRPSARSSSRTAAPASRATC